MTKREIMKLSDAKLDKVVKIQGTNWDRKRKVTKRMQRNMLQMLNAGKSVSMVAMHFGVTPHTVRYNTNQEYNEWYKVSRTSRKHYGANGSAAERGAYKRSLLKARKDVIYS